MRTMIGFTNDSVPVFISNAISLLLQTEAVSYMKEVGDSSMKLEEEEEVGSKLSNFWGCIVCANFAHHMISCLELSRAAFTVATSHQEKEEEEGE